MLRRTPSFVNSQSLPNDYYKYYDIYKLKYNLLTKNVNNAKKILNINKITIVKKQPRKLVAIDFDKTFMKVSLPGLLLKFQNDLNVKKFPNSIKKFTKIYNKNVLLSDSFLNKQFIDYLMNIKKDHVLAIVSYGTNEGIHLILKRYNLDNIFDHVLTPSSFGFKDCFAYTKELEGKNVMLKRIQKKYGIINKNVILVDDDKYNIGIANKKGYNTSHVIEMTGMNKKNENDIIKFIKFHY
jgi:FMN phosphatase YigB (HAD superfamily)